MKLTAKEIEIKNKLEIHYKNFDKTKISPDPLEFPRRFKSRQDIEISAFISSLFAYGNIKQIMKVLGRIHSVMGFSPYSFVMEYSASKKSFKGIKHRFYSTSDIEHLFSSLKKVYTEHDSLEYFFTNSNSLKDNISIFSKEMTRLCSKNNQASLGNKFMFPNPNKGSACKRMNLFLRWMVRNDDLDFGLWKSISTSQLIIPVDVHVARISKQLKLTAKKNVTWKMAQEITENLKKFDPIDPIKYDFAICHIGMRKLKF